MNKTLTPALAALSATALLSAGAMAAPVALDPFFTLGQGGANLATPTGNSGGTVAYAADPRNDIGLGSDFAAPAFANVGDKLTYTYTVQDITSSFDRNNTFRAGIGFGSTASLSFNSGIGVSRDGRFNLTANGNAFSGGAQLPGASGTFTATGGANQIDTGNTIDVTLCLELTATNGTTFDYAYSATFASGMEVSTLGATITGLTSGQANRVYHLTNASEVKIDGDGWTISNAAVDFTAVPEPASVALLTAGGALLLGRRRRA